MKGIVECMTLSLLCIGTGYMSFSQTKIDTVYIKYPDAKANTTRDSAAYYRVRTVSGTELKAEDYSMKDSVLKCSAYYKSFDPNIKQGLFVDYSPNVNGTLSVARIEGNYVNDKKDGIWKYYFSGGELWYTETYAEGYKNGMLKSYYKTGEVKRVEEYKDDKLMQGKCYTRDGKDTAFYNMFILPLFPGGEKAQHDYVIDHIIYPEQARKLGIQGIVFVSYVVNTDGSIGDVEVVKGKGAHPLLDRAAVDCVKQMPAMTPGYMDGTPVKVKMAQRIKFAFQ